LARCQALSDLGQHFVMAGQRLANCAQLLKYQAFVGGGSRPLRAGLSGASSLMLASSLRASSAPQ